MYIAKHYVKANGKVYMRGECLPEDLSEKRIEWLKGAGAIEEIAPVSSDTPAQMDLVAEEPQEDVEVPEIDVMAGIIQEETEKPEKPRRKSQRGGKSK